MRALAAIALVGASIVPAQVTHPAVNPDSAIIADFEKRVADYMQMRKSVESHMPALKPTPSVDQIEHHETELGKELRNARARANEGDFFTPPVAAEFKRLIGIAMEADGKKIRESLRHAEPVRMHLRVNGRYPHNVPLQSTPPSLIRNLPMLPPEIEYRIIGSELILLDAKANLVLDVIEGLPG